MNPQAVSDALGIPPTGYGAVDAALGSGAAGAVGSLIGGGARGVISPNLAPEVRLLHNEGVAIPPGKMGIQPFGALEYAARRTPLVNEAVTAADRNAIRTYNVAWGNRALAPIGERVDADAVAGYPSDKSRP